jgi:hypothetical protein
VVRWAKLITSSLGGLGPFPPIEINSCAFHSYIKESAENCVVELHVSDIMCLHCPYRYWVWTLKLTQTTIITLRFLIRFTTHNTYKYSTVKR